MTEEMKQNEDVMQAETLANLDAATEVQQPEPTPEPKPTESAKPARNPAEWVTEHFKWSEFLYSATAVRLGLPNQPNEMERKNIRQTAELLEKIRALLGEKYGKTLGITISSGFRSERVNRAVGGSPTSAHKLGLAADIHATGLTPSQLAYDIQGFMDKGLLKIDQVILEKPRGSKGWVHVGLRQGTNRGQKLVYNGHYIAVKRFDNPNLA